MNRNDFLLEIGVEEMPARFVDASIRQLASDMEKWLQEMRIDYLQLKKYATPRRLAVLVEGMADRQGDRVEEMKGPAKKIAQNEQGQWTKAALGFAKSQGVSAEDLYVKTFKGQAYVYAKKHEAGAKTADLLPRVKEVITSLSFPKKMRWGAHDFAFIRPIRWLVALYGSEVIPFELAGVISGNETEGHRFLGRKITLEKAQDYVSALQSEHVIPDIQERQNMILTQLEKLQSKMNWRIEHDPELVDEITHLVEYPTAISGSFDDQFLTVPHDVLITSMREHQRYFPVRNEDGRLLPFFVTIRNGREDEEGIVSRGNEKVLRARLADARFFYTEDQKLTIDSALSRLEHVVFHEELGSMADKVRRIRQLTKKLAETLGMDGATMRQADRAAEICKFDLVTQMVDEFPELQGKMGAEYARLAGEDEEVASAVYEHYLPRSADDDLPPSDIGGLISIADKMDTLVSSFSIGLVPTGSQDPYALRRQAAGIILIILTNNWPLNLKMLTELTLNIFSQQQLIKRGEDDIKQDVADFFSLRLRNRLQELKVRYDVIDALLPAYQGEVLSLFAKAEALMKQVNEDDFKPTVEAFTRVNNMVQNVPSHAPDVRSERFEDSVERDLLAAYENAQRRFQQCVEQSDWEQAYQVLAQLEQPIVNFFEQVMVMAEDDAVRQNRLALLYHVDSLIKRYADFSQIVFAAEK